MKKLLLLILSCALSYVWAQAQTAYVKSEVQGHCDNTGSDAVNDPLSQKRAEAIVARLVQLGISADRLTAVGKGSHEPIADNSTEEGRAKNRRVEFIKK